ncbi:MAG TPA: glutamate--tRNA ligase family protein, partial [Bacteroidia bacterium]|nr:glutamate--tRNA ligase family protein [Bacteroidia bacterium]
IPRNEEIRVKDLIRGWVVVHSGQMDDKVLFKSDGMPTYHLANVVDDYTMKITHVIRGEEWLPSAPLHVLLYRSLGWESVMPEFAHLPLLLRPDGNGKLSKRDGDRLGFPVFPISGSLLDTKTNKPESFSGYREAGYFPDAFVNMLALLGWHSSGNQELYTLDELVKEFSLDRVSKSGAKFDPEKTKWFNQQYLRKRTDAELAAVWLKELEGKGIKTTLAYVEKAVHLIKEKAVFSTDFWTLGSFLFEAPVSYDAEVIKKRWNEKSAQFVAEVSKAFAALEPFNATTAEACFKASAETMGIKTGEVMQLFRVCLIGSAVGPALFELAELLGKEESVKRLNQAFTQLKTAVA